MRVGGGSSYAGRVMFCHLPLSF